MQKLYSLLLGAVALTANAIVPDGPYLDPQGEIKDYAVEYESFLVSWGDVGIDKSTAPTQVIFNGDNEVYFNPIPTSDAPGWIKGTIADGKIHVTLPQCIGYVSDPFTDDYSNGYVNLLEYIEIDGYSWYVNVPDETTEIVYTLSEDGTFTLDLTDPESANYFADKILGIVTDLSPDSDSWIGCGTWKAAYKEFDMQPITLPEGLVAEEWLLSHEWDGRLVNVAIDGDKFYLGNLTDELPDSYVIGTIEDGQVTFPITFMGISEDYNKFAYFVPAEFEEIFLPEYNEFWEDYVTKETYTFDYDAEAKTLTYTVDYSAILIGDLTPVGELAGSYIEYYYEPVISWLNPAMADGALQDPEFTIAYNFRDWYGCDIVEFFLPAFNENNYPLDTNRISYVFYINGKPLTLTPDVYIGLDEDMTMIPYNFIDEVNQDVYCYGQEHQISVFALDYATVGLKMYYEKEDGTMLESNYVEENIEILSDGEILAGVSASNLDNTVKSVVYYDMQGRAVASPRSGIYIKVATMANGTRQTSKVVVK